MASVTTMAGEAGFAPAFHGGTITPTEQSAKEQDKAARAALRLSEMPRIERVGPVRIMRGAEGWRGVTLRLQTGQEDCFELALTAGDGRSVTVATLSGDDAIAAWRGLGRSTGLPLLIETCDGIVTEPYPQLGRLALGPIRIRRRHALLAGRRPRFLTRRKTTRLAERPVVLNGDILSG